MEHYTEPYHGRDGFARVVHAREQRLGRGRCRRTGADAERHERAVFERASDLVDPRELRQGVRRLVDERVQFGEREEAAVRAVARLKRRGWAAVGGVDELGPARRRFCGVGRYVDRQRREFQLCTLRRGRIRRVDRVAHEFHTQSQCSIGFAAAAAAAVGGD